MLVVVSPAGLISAFRTDDDVVSTLVSSSRSKQPTRYVQNSVASCCVPIGNHAGRHSDTNDDGLIALLCVSLKKQITYSTVWSLQLGIPITSMCKDRVYEDFHGRRAWTTLLM